MELGPKDEGVVNWVAIESVMAGIWTAMQGDIAWAVSVRCWGVVGVTEVGDGDEDSNDDQALRYGREGCWWYYRRMQRNRGG